MLKSKNSLSEINRIVFYFIVITLSISLAFLTSLEDGRDYLLIRYMSLGPFVYVLALKRMLKAEGCYIEPDTIHGYGYLEAIRDAIMKVEEFEHSSHA